MSESERMRALLDGYRREIAATPDDRQRVWARLEQGESAAPEDAPQVRRGITIAIAIAVAVAATVVLVLGLAERIAQRTADATPQQSADVIGPAPVANEIAIEIATPARPPARVQHASEPAVAMPELQRPTDTTGVPQRARAEDPLHAELALVDSARAAIDRGTPELALERLAEHRTRFPEGALGPEARALRAIALCDAGHTAQGRGEARVLLRERDSLAHHARVREACGVQ